MQKIIDPVDLSIIESELKKDFFLRKTNKASNEIYIFRAEDAPNLMREVGRLREEAFRFHGGGTGKEVDIDEFDYGDNSYMQLIVWDPAEKAILGGYRFIFGSDVRILDNGKPHLATAEMFDFSDNFMKNYLPYTIELGRSFVSLPYQSTLKGSKSIFALDNLWDGIGALTKINTDMKYFYGKVTIYKQYNRYARNLILYFLDKYFGDKDGLITPIDALPIDIDENLIYKLFDMEASFNENYKILNNEVRKLNINIPPLVSAYMALSPEMKVFGTAINKEFGEVEETGILIAVDKIIENKINRHIDTFSPSEEDKERIWKSISRQDGLGRK